MPVIGEGSYGCVHKPSLKCNTSEIVDYTNKISKLLIKKEATNEIKEYSALNKIDKAGKHYMGMPIKCKVKNDDSTMQEIRKCSSSDKFTKDLSNLRLLIMNDGGSSISDIFKNDFKTISTEERIVSSELVLIFMYNIFNSINFFIKKKVYHRDIKLENIVFNLKEKKINIIDFGLMDNKHNLTLKANNNNYNLNIIWWSLAPYSLFINKDKFEQSRDDSYGRDWFNNFIATHKLDKDAQLDYFFKRITKNNSLNEATIRPILLNELKSNIEKLSTVSHDKYLENVFPLLDVHNLGIIMLELVGYVKPYVKNDTLMTKMLNLGLKMISFDSFNHITIDKSMNEYKKMLLGSKLLEKHNFKMVNNEIIKIETKKTYEPEKYPITTVLEKLNTNIIQIQDSKSKKKISEPTVRKSTTSKHVRFTSPDIRRTSKKTISDVPIRKSTTSKHVRFTSPDIRRTSKKTPPGKIRNPTTGRFINKPKTQTRKNTPPGKIRNPTTGRFINKPKITRDNPDITDGLTDKQTKMLKKFIHIIKNNKGRQQNIKITTNASETTRKTKKQKQLEKKTPPGKMRNPKTGNFINLPKTQTRKKTPPGKMRNPISGRFINKPKKQTRKKTPPGKIRNPETGRFINKPKKQTQKKQITVTKVNKIEKGKKCPPGKVINPETGRCIEEFKKKRFIFF